MSAMTTGGRRAVAAIFAAMMITTVACGNQDDTHVDDPAPMAPGAIRKAPFHPSADAAERYADSHPQVPVTPDIAERRYDSDVPSWWVGKRIPD
jgi:hypothetical protein